MTEEQSPAEPEEERDAALSLKGGASLPAINLGPWFRSGTEFLGDVRSEFTKISWPTRQQVVTETGVVIFVVLLLTLLVISYDFIFTFLSDKVFFGK